jgi:hypothetical protein
LAARKKHTYATDVQDDKGCALLGNLSSDKHPEYQIAVADACGILAIAAAMQGAS